METLQLSNLLSPMIQSKWFCVANCNSQFLLANSICIWLIICLVALSTLNRTGLFCWLLYDPSAAKHGCDIIHSIYPKTTTTTTTTSLLMGMQCYEREKIIWHFVFQCLLLVCRGKLCRYSPFIRNSAVKLIFLPWVYSTKETSQHLDFTYFSNTINQLIKLLHNLKHFMFSFILQDIFGSSDLGTLFPSVRLQGLI